MILGYNTNGLASHSPNDALQLLSDIGYKSVAITIDHNWLNPNSEQKFDQLASIKKFLDHAEFRNVVETGARFLLDPYRKHWPTLMDADDGRANQRLEFLKYCIDTAVFLNSDCVSIWSGQKPEDMPLQEALDRLAGNLRVVLDYAEQQKMDIGFEPEPGMLIDTTGRFERLIHLVDSPRLKMTLDIGHLFCLSEMPISSFIEKWRDRLVNVHIEDMKAGVHEHLMFGDGQIHFPPVIESLVQIEYDGPVHVELSRHSYNAAEIARKSYGFLKPIIDDAKSTHELG